MTERHSNNLILFLEYDGFSPEALAKLREVFDVAFCCIENLDRFEEKERVAGLFVRLKSRIDDTVFDHLPNLKFVISPTTGHNHLDLDAMVRRSIQVISLKGETEFLGSITATAELTWGLILSLTRRIPQAINHVAMGGWDRDTLRGLDLSGRILGIVGYGRLGRIIEDYARVFRMKVLINDTAIRSPIYGQMVPLMQLLSESDIVTVHVDVNPGSVNMFSEAEFRCMKATAFFINTSRGELVNELSLVKALEENWIAGAAVDVIDNEHLGHTSSPLYRLKNSLEGKLLITPHIGGASRDSMLKTEMFIVNKLLSLYQDKS